MEPTLPPSPHPSFEAIQGPGTATRHLTLIHHKGNCVAQYGAQSGAPSFVGIMILHFLRREDNIAALTRSLDNNIVFDVSWEYVRYLEQTCKERHGFGWNHYPDFQGFTNDHSELPPSLDRNLGAGILHIITTATLPVPVCRRFDLLLDYTCCEWTYVVDLDARCFEVYGPVCPIPRNRLSIGQESADGYVEAGPVSLAGYSFDELPDDERFLEELQQREYSEVAKVLDEFVDWTRGEAEPGAEE
ncbi:hypothetical protein K461DRAFT_298125 [Myriangium duriaei CBS 260.36]|uniref:Uncharacterized protein n=1 Tax=Myriangium duriaei CBS 260.36 TaxID=1168546 RepID=A0A9P4MBV7_9PEZI|nr:hypothetical protein K461DRAFT_298125 [Myriangium duriaei CBS 260.36]